MDQILLTPDQSLWNILFLSIFAFIAGFIDAVAGGGGLIQLPALLIQYPQTTIATLLGTNKIAAFSGTFFSTIHYGKRITFDYKLLFIISAFAAIASYSGARVVHYIDVSVLKPVILVILILIFVYTLFKKNLGTSQTKTLTFNQQAFWGSFMATVLGFYDGFFGPGTGSFFMLGFVVLLGFEFVQASAYSKFINSVTNIAAIFVFVSQGHFFPLIAVIMAVSNIAGNITGTKTALKRGNTFVRVFFMIVVSLLIMRYGYDIFREYFT